MTIEQAKQNLDKLQRTMAAYNHALGLVEYDGATTAPKKTAANRGETIGVLSEASYRLITGEDTMNLLDFLWENREELDEITLRCTEELRKGLKDMRAVPMEEYLEFQKLFNESDDVWHTAKENSDYASFEPYLARVIEAQKKMMGYIEPDKDPYDALLNRFEEGLTREICDAFFSALRARLVPLIQKVCDSPYQVDESVLKGRFALEGQRKLTDRLMDMLLLDRGHCGVGETEHPFTTSFTKYDVRITTHYYEDQLASSIYSVIHEGGHALYGAHPADELAYTCLGDGCCMSVHESQSRFYENLIGRSLPFVRRLGKTLREIFPQLEGVSDEKMYEAFNASHPSLIRIEADELTYCLHIMIRYELEKKLFAGEITTKELPGEWNRLYKEYLGVDVPDDRRGVLQDSHWASGSFGYFPSYALGSAYGAQMLAKMKETLDVDQCALEDLTPVNEWLEENVWKYGMLLKPKALLEKVFGGPFDPEYYLKYLEEKFTAIYRL